MQAIADLDTHPHDRPRPLEAGDQASARSTSSQFDGLPEEIWEAHRRVADALDQA